MRYARIITTLVIILSIYAGIQWMIGWHGWVFLNTVLTPPPYLLGIYSISIAAAASAFILGKAFNRYMPYKMSKVLKVSGAYWLVVVQYGVLLLPLADLAAWLLRWASVDGETSIQLSGGAVMLIFIYIFAKGSWNAWHPVVRHYKLDLARTGKSAAHDDKSEASDSDSRTRKGKQVLRIVAASDLHLGDIVGKKHLRRLIKEVQSLAPDLVLLPGDVIDDDIRPFLREGMAEELEQLRAPHGVYAVLGNHEYYGGALWQYVQEMERIGIRVLQDETVVHPEGYIIVGRKDKTAESQISRSDKESQDRSHGKEGQISHSNRERQEGGHGTKGQFNSRDKETQDASRGSRGRKSHEQLAAGLDRTKPWILLDHQPYDFDLAARAGFDMMISGHTHRGQMAPNHWLTQRLFELDYGYKQKERMHVWVSSGFGLWGPPIRIGSRSELLYIEMVWGGEQ